MKKTGRLRGACDSCQEVTELHGTEQYGEWLCLSCKEVIYAGEDSLQLREVNGKTYITGLGL